VFKVSSIKQLLQLWSVGTVFAIVLMAMAGIYTNFLFSNTQQQLTEKVIPVEGLIYNISNLVAAFATQEKYLVASNLLDTAGKDRSRQELEQTFKLYWQNLPASLNDDEAKQAAEQSRENYQLFLEVDAQLLVTMNKRRATHLAIEKKVADIENNQSEVNTALLLLAAQAGQAPADNVINQRKLFIASKTLALDIVTLSNLILRLEQKKHTKSSLSSLATEIKRVTSDFTADFMTLKSAVGPGPNTSEILRTIANNIQSMKAAAIEGNSSLYQLQSQKLNDESKLVFVQQKSIATLSQLVQGLNDLSHLIRQQSMTDINNAISIADKTRWVLVVLMLLAALGVIKFISNIYSRINEPFEDVRSAMHALSSKRFDTRLNRTDYIDEFTSLATDFNQFASTTQVLIEDLDATKQSLQQQEVQLRTILNGVPEAIITLNAEGVIVSINPYAEQVLKAAEKKLLGEPFTRFFEQSEQITSMTTLLEMQEQTKEFKGLDYNAQPFSMWLSLSAISEQAHQHFVCVLSDVTEWKQTELKLIRSSSELDTILENAMVGIAFMKDRQLLRVNHKFEEIFGYSKEEIIGNSTRYLCADEAVFNELASAVFSRLEEGDTFEGDVQFARKNGDVFWCGLSTKAVSPGQPQEGTIWIFEDITKQREDQQNLRNLANLDALTKLPNRSVFNDRLMHAIHKARRNTKRLAIFFLDLDHFKHINDSLGHKAGDQLLCEVAKRLKACVREGDTVARLGGDEFTLILEDIQSVQYVAKIAEKVISSVSKSYMLGTTEVNITPSIGVSLYPADGRDVDVLVRNADAAMYHAKNTGRNNFQFYSAEMNAQAAHRLAMETSLRRAVELEDFYLHFQPQIDIGNNKIIGAEVLLRWQSRQWGEVSPVEFIPILEDTGLIVTVGEQVLFQACEAYMSLRDKLDPDFKIAVNLSGRQFKGAGPLAVYVRNVLERTGMSAANLELEITESILMEDTNLAIKTLSELSELGVTLAIDDFGTGYSSLSYLKKFPLNVLKIDKSFIDDITHEGDDAAIVDAILAMSGHLQLEVVAEGIETLEQLKFLQQRQCQRGQGYFFSRPLSFEAFENLVQNREIVVAH
jgi:diguanylate cyclase (GGDEF)-like protein/PAS domain S-box-containing protein